MGHADTRTEYSYDSKFIAYTVLYAYLYNVGGGAWH